MLLKKIKDFFANYAGNNRGFYPALNSVFQPASLSRTDYLTLYKGWIFTATGTISDSIADLDFQLRVSKDSPKIKQDKRLEAITPTLLKNISSFLKLAWSCFVWQSSFWLEVLRPDLVRIDQDTTTWHINYYEYTSHGQVKKFSPEEIIAFHNFNPLEAYPVVTKWVSEVQAVAIQAESDNATLRWNWNYFKNNASVANILKTDQMLQDDVKQRLVSKWNSEFQGLDNAHKTAVLDQWLSLESFAPSQKEMDFVEQRRFTRDEILWVFKVPKAIIWLWEWVNVWNVKAFEGVYAKNTIKPLAKLIADVFNETLFKGVGYFEFINVVPLDKEELRKDLDAWAITINEYRATIWKLPLDEWNILKLNPFQVSEPVSVIQPKENSKTKLSSKTLKAISKAIKTNTKGSDEWKEKRWEKMIKRNDWFEDDYKKQLLKIYNIQEKDILKQIEKSFESQLKFGKNIKVKFPEWNDLKYLALYQSLVWPVQKDLVKTEWNLALAEVWVDAAFQIWDETSSEFLRTNIAKFAKEIDLVTKEKIFDKITQWNKEWLWAAEITRNLKWVFKQLKTTRLESITRTETIRAANFASQKAWVDSEVVEFKEWFTATDERVCLNCWPMHGKTIWLRDDFFQKGSIAPWGLKLDYSDVSWAPLHPRCRCTLIPLLK